MIELMVAEDIEIVAEYAVQNRVSLTVKEIEISGVAGNLIACRDHDEPGIRLPPCLSDAHESLRSARCGAESPPVLRAEGDPYRVNIGVDVIHVEDLQGVRRIRGRYP